MTSRACLLGLVALFCLCSGVAHAAPGRYAIVIGNNVALGEATDLNHADDDARAFQDVLLDVGRFDRARTRLLIDAGPNELLKAARELQQVARRDAQQDSGGESVFVVYFTGHGSPAGLLTQSTPITGRDLLETFRAVNADHQIGIFDACHAGKLASFNTRALDPKGVALGPNPFVSLPRELDALEGVLLAGAQDIAYEAPLKGGLFTYFLIESLRDQRHTVVSLGDAFQYAQARTQRFVLETNRVQRPASRNLNAAARMLPLGFPRSTEVIFGPSVRGTFLFDYPNGGLRERMRASGSFEVAAGEVDVFQVTPNATRALGRIVLEPEGRLLIRGADDPVPFQLDYIATASPMVSKSGTALTLTSERRIEQLVVGVGHVWLPIFESPAAMHAIELLVSARSGRWVLGAFLRGGRRVRPLEWPLTLSELGAGVEAGAGWLSARGTSVDGLLRLSAGAEHRAYDSGSSTAAWVGLSPALRVRQRVGALGIALTGGWLIRNGRAGLERGADRAWWGAPMLSTHLDWAL